jgi:glycosyltransferase involved in cell wall biosynthesis
VADEEPPLVSVVTPSYNQAEFLEDTLRSVMVQDHPRIEHWIVDGESDDGTLEILERFEDRAAEVDGYELRWLSEPDRGQSHAINKGLDRASGDVIGWLNSDDMYFDRRILSDVVGAFDATDADVVYGDMVLVDEDNRLLRVEHKPDFDRNLLLRACFICQPALLFRAETLEGNRLDETLDYVMDYEFWIRLSEEFEFAHIDRIVAADRNHPDRKILKNREELADEREQLQRSNGQDFGLKYRLARLGDRITSGRNRLRGIRSMMEVIGRNDLAFDMQFDNSVLGTYRQIASKNRSLV